VRSSKTMSVSTFKMQTCRGKKIQKEKGGEEEEWKTRETDRGDFQKMKSINLNNILSLTWICSSSGERVAGGGTPETNAPRQKKTFPRRMVTALQRQIKIRNLNAIRPQEKGKKKPGNVRGCSLGGERKNRGEQLLPFWERLKRSRKNHDASRW